MTSQNPEWCITFLMYDNKWYNDINDTDTLGLPKNNDKYISLNEQSNQLIAWIDGNILYDNKVKIFYIDIKISEHEKNYKLFFYEKKLNGIFLNKLKTIELVKNYTGTTQKSIENILFQTIGIENAEKNMFIPIGHGAVWGINPYNYKDDLSKLKSADIPNRLWLQSPITIKQKAYIKTIENKSSTILNRFNDTFIEIKHELGNWAIHQAQNILSKFKENQNEKDNVIRLSNSVELFLLTNKEINEAIKNVLDQKKLDILVLDSCLMQNIFTQYELKDTVDFLIASESGITFPGHNYIDVINGIIDGIKTNKLKSSKEVAESFSTTISTHPAYAEFGDEMEKTWCFSCIQLQNNLLDKLKIEFNSLFDDIMKFPAGDLNETIKVFKSVLNQAFFYDTYSMSGQISMVDIRIFFMKFYEIINGNKTFTKNTKSTLLEKINSINLIIETIYLDITFYRAKDFYENSQTIQTDEKDKYKNNISTGITMPQTKVKSLMLETIIINDKKAHYPSFITTNNFGLFLQNLR